MRTNEECKAMEKEKKMKAVSCGVATQEDRKASCGADAPADRPAACGAEAPAEKKAADHGTASGASMKYEAK